MSDTEVIAINLKEFRLSASLTQDDLAKHLGVSRTTVTMWETGKSLPRAELIPKIAERCGCSTDDLFNLIKESGPESA